MVDMFSRHANDAPGGSGLPGLPKGRGARFFGLAMLGVMPAIVAFSALGTQGGCCRGTLPTDREPDAAMLGSSHQDPRQGSEPPSMDQASDAAMLGEGGDEKTSECAMPVVIKVYIGGNYVYDSMEHSALAEVRGPSLVTQYSYHWPRPPGSDLQPRCTATVPLSGPYFAAPFSTAELCSTEEASPTHLRFACLGSGGRLMTVEYRIEEKRYLVITTDHPNEGRSVIKDGRYITPMPLDACATLVTEIPRRDLAPLQQAYLNDTPSPRCQASSQPRRKVPATFIRVPFPKGHEYYEPRPRPCLGLLNPRPRYDATQVHLGLPPSIGPTQDLGILDSQCWSCFARRLRKPNGAKVGCDVSNGGRRITTYQLGDHLYVVHDDYVRQVALPCGITLDFRMTEFVAPLYLNPEGIQ